MSPRKSTPPKDETEVLVKSHRKCCYCFGLENNLETKPGQIAHLDRDHSNSIFENLAYMCFDHHHQYDSSSKQAKGFTQKEAKHYRDMLYKLLAQNYEEKLERYKYKYLQKTIYTPLLEDWITPQARTFLNNLDLMKQKADESFAKENAGELDVVRLRQINDYVFKIYKEIYFIQNRWQVINGRFYQGKNTLLDIPDYNKDSKISKYFGLTHQVDDWEDIGYYEEFAPVQLECHVYEGPEGQGFTIFARVKIDETVWQNQMHKGPEEYRNNANFSWVKINLGF